jgi:hypothetical protein
VIKVAEKKQNDCGCGCLTQPKKGSKTSQPKKGKSEKPVD